MIDELDEYQIILLSLFLGLNYKFFEMPLKTAIFELLNPQKYIECVLGRLMNGY